MTLNELTDNMKVIFYVQLKTLAYLKKLGLVGLGLGPVLISFTVVVRDRFCPELTPKSTFPFEII